MAAATAAKAKLPRDLQANLAVVSLGDFAQAGEKKSGYTLALVGSQNRRELIEYVDNNDLKNTKIIETKADGKRWYVLSYGHFDSLSAAQAAKAKLPSGLQANLAISSTANLFESTSNNQST